MIDHRLNSIKRKKIIKKKNREFIEKNDKLLRKMGKMNVLLLLAATEIEMSIVIETICEKVKQVTRDCRTYSEHL